MRTGELQSLEDPGAGFEGGPSRLRMKPRVPRAMNERPLCAAGEPKLAGASMTKCLTGARSGPSWRCSQSQITNAPVLWTMASTATVRTCCSRTRYCWRSRWTTWSGRPTRSGSARRERMSRLAQAIRHLHGLGQDVDAIAAALAFDPERVYRTPSGSSRSCRGGRAGPDRPAGRRAENRGVRELRRSDGPGGGRRRRRAHAGEPAHGGRRSSSVRSGAQPAVINRFGEYVVRPRRCYKFVNQPGSFASMDAKLGIEGCFGFSPLMTMLICLLGADQGFRAVRIRNGYLDSSRFYDYSIDIDEHPNIR